MPDRFGCRVTIKTTRQHVHGGTDNIIKNVRSNSAALAYDFARTTKSHAVRNVHVITGRLKRSITAEKVGPNHWRVRVGAYYGVYEEYGTRYRPPHPYLRPAVEIAKAQYERQRAKVFNG